MSNRERRQLLLPVLLVVFLAALDLTVVAPILPTVIDDLGISPVDADRYSWIVLAYLVAYTVTVPLTGRVSDFVGRIPVFTAAMLLFMVGSVVVATADSLGGMILGRTLQGLGGGAMLPVSMALVADVIPTRQRAFTLGLVAAVDTFGWVLGPVWGSAISEVFNSWRAIFWLNLPLGAIAAAVLYFTRARTIPRLRQERPHLLSAVVGTVALVAFCLALSSGGEAGLSAGQGAARLGGETNPLTAYRWPLLGLSLVMFVVFLLLERRATAPILPRALIRERLFQVAGLANVLVGAALITAMVNAPLAVALLADEDAVSLDTALLLGSFTLAMTVGALIGGRVVNIISPRIAAVAGLVVAAAGFLVMHGWSDDLRIGMMSVTMAVAGLGLGIVIAPIGEVAIRASRVHDYGAASGLVLLARLLGMTVGLSGITAYGLQRLDTKLADLPPLTPQPGESTSAFFARQQTFLNDQIIPLTLDVIRETFVIAAIVCLVALLVALRLNVVARHGIDDESAD
jgi:MFS family permease